MSKLSSSKLFSRHTCLQICITHIAYIWHSFSACFITDVINLLLVRWLYQHVLLLIQTISLIKLGVVLFPPELSNLHRDLKLKLMCDLLIRLKDQ